MSKTLMPETHVRRGGRLVPAHVERVLGDLRGRIDADVLALQHDQAGHVLTLEEGGILRKWNCKTGQLVETNSLGDVESCWAVRNDGRYLASGAGGITVWDVDSGMPIVEHEVSSWVTAIAFGDDVIATGHDDHKVRLWDARTGKLRHVLTSHHDEISAIAFTAKGERLATASEDRMVYLWDVRRGDRVGKLEGHTDRVDDLAWSHSGHRIASAGWDTSVRVWNASTGELLALLNGQGECVHTVTFTPDGKWIVCGDSDGYVRVWDYEKLKIRAEYKTHVGATRRLSVRHDGKQVVSGGTDRVVQFLSIPELEPIAEITGGKTSVVSMAVTDHVVAAIHAESAIHTFSLRTGRAVHKAMADEKPSCIASNADGKAIVGTLSGSLSVHLSIEEDAIITWSGHDAAVRLVAIRPDGGQVASTASSDGTVRVWDPNNGEPVLIIPEATRGGSIEAMAYHPFLPILATAGIDWTQPGRSAGVITLWNCRDVRLDRHFEAGATALAFSPDGRYLAAVSLADSIVVWSLATNQVVREIDSGDATVNAIAFSPDSKRLVSASDDSGIRAWDTAQWRMQASLELETPIKCLAFTPDGKAIVTGNGNSACYIISADALS